MSPGWAGRISTRSPPRVVWCNSLKAAAFAGCRVTTSGTRQIISPPLRGRLQEALADCKAALRIDPADETGVGESAFANRGVIGLKLGEYDAAISDFDAALKNDRHLGRALYGRGVARKKRGDAKGGDADLAAAIAVNPDIAAEFDQWRLNDRAAPATANEK